MIRVRCGNKAKKKRATFLLCRSLFFMYLRKCEDFRPQRSSRWRVFRGSSRTRGIHGGTKRAVRNCCTSSAAVPPNCRVFFSLPYGSVRICVLDVA